MTTVTIQNQHQHEINEDTLHWLRFKRNLPADATMVMTIFYNLYGNKTAKKKSKFLSEPIAVLKCEPIINKTICEFNLKISNPLNQQVCEKEKNSTTCYPIIQNYILLRIAFPDLRAPCSYSFPYFLNA